MRSVALARDADGRLTGKVNFALRNESTMPVRLTVRFFADRDPRPRRVAVGTSPLALAAPPPSLSGHATSVLAATVTLSKSQPPSDLDGALVVQARAHGELVDTAELRLTGALALPKDVAFEPSKVTLQVTKFWPLAKTSGDQTTVRLRGPGVARLIASVGKLVGAAGSRQPTPAGQTAQPATSTATLLLTNDSGDQTLVELSNLHQTGADLAEVTVSTHAACPEGATPCEQAAPKPGAYTGALALSPGAIGGPKLDVTVHSEQWLFIPVVLVLLGSLIGGLLPQLTQTAEMKDRLRGELRPLLDRYTSERSKPGAQGLVWRLGSVLGDEPWYEKRYRGLPGEGGVAALWADIHSARTMEDLTADSGRVLELGGHVRRWLHVLPLAAELAELHSNPPADRPGHPWRVTNLRYSTEKMLRGLADRLPPKDDQEANELSEELRRQTQLHRAFAHAWSRRAELQHVPASDNDRERDKEWWDKADIDAFDGTLPTLAPNDPDMSDRLTKMADVSEAIERLLASYDQRVTPAEVGVEMSPARSAAVLAQLEAGGRGPEEIAQRAGVSVTEVADIEAGGGRPETAAVIADGDRVVGPRRRQRAWIRGTEGVMLDNRTHRRDQRGTEVRGAARAGGADEETVAVDAAARAARVACGRPRADDDRLDADNRHRGGHRGGLHRAAEQGHVGVVGGLGDSVRRRAGRTGGHQVGAAAGSTFASAATGRRPGPGGAIASGPLRASAESSGAIGETRRPRPNSTGTPRRCAQLSGDGRQRRRPRAGAASAPSSIRRRPPSSSFKAQARSRAGAGTGLAAKGPAAAFAIRCVRSERTNEAPIGHLLPSGPNHAGNVAVCGYRVRRADAPILRHGSVPRSRSVASSFFTRERSSCPHGCVRYGPCRVRRRPSRR